MENFTKSLFLCVMCILSVFIVGFSMLNIPQYELSKSEQAVNKVLAEMAPILAKKYKSKVIGESAAMPGGVIKKLGLEFQICGPLKKEEIRKILLESVNEFVSFINANVEIKPYLEHYPFTIENVEIELYVIDANGKSLDDPDIGIAGASKGKLDYLTLIKTDVRSIKSRVLESYEDALKTMQVDNAL